jgi:hypothetical protein
MRKLPTWIPQTPRPSSSISERAGYGETWDAMTPNERRWSFLLTDLPVILVGIAAAWVLFG